MPENTDYGGGEDMYADAVPSQTRTPAAPAEEAETDTETALLPQSLCPGMSPGDEIVLKIVRVHDDQYEVAYSEAPKEEEPETSGRAELPESEMASMME